MSLFNDSFNPLGNVGGPAYEANGWWHDVNGHMLYPTSSIGSSAPQPVHSVLPGLEIERGRQKRLFVVAFIAIAQTFVTVPVIGGAGLALGAIVFGWCLYRYFRSKPAHSSVATKTDTTSRSRQTPNASCFIKSHR
jgi:hypothetical protein